MGFRFFDSGWRNAVLSLLLGWGFLSILGDRRLFQTSHNFDTVTLGRMDFLPLAGTKMEHWLEAKDVNSLHQLLLDRAS